MQDMERKHAAREKMIADGMPRNAAIADTEVGWEIGSYNLSDEELAAERRQRGEQFWYPDCWPEEMERGLIIRTRRDALQTKLDVADILDRLDKLERRPATVPQGVYFLLGMIFIVTVGFPVLQSFGLYNP